MSHPKTQPVWPPRGTHLELVGRVRVLVVDTTAEGDLLPEFEPTEPANSSRLRAAPALPPLSPIMRELAYWLAKPVPGCSAPKKRSA